ncbi:uncharacterized protein [Nicotiana sylvestris]|uniref:Uncharacterized protein LOC104219421 n=1 Tax=Nicotiana sylvestris TaxID=4096 RepID=A0A1U7W2D3_NICSY|nr:PREDICTED: uncharacterized protein LOC104219421 [Nicotiana sylvestris]
MDQSNNGTCIQFTSAEYPNAEIQPGPPVFTSDPPDHPHHNIKAPKDNCSEAKPVLNFSLQTGEEFVLEFMRDRVNPGKNYAPSTSSDPSFPQGCLELKGILGIGHTGSDGGSDTSMLAMVEKGPKEFEKQKSSLHEDKNYNGSVQSVQQTSSDYCGFRSLVYTSSGACDDSVAKLKAMCSFGGKVLSRPSDGKLRYVGGETRVIRIRKDITWNELWQKAVVIYDLTHIIKYQLPGEDLDALVSVSCDEDLQNMLEECDVLEDGDTSKKLRIFLCSIADLDDAHLRLTNSDADSEFQYVVAINGLETGSRSSSTLHFLGSSANSLAELDGNNMEEDSGRSVTGFVGASNLPSAGFDDSSLIAKSAQPNVPSPPSAYDIDLRFHHGQMENCDDSKQQQFQFGYSSNSQFSATQSATHWFSKGVVDYQNDIEGQGSQTQVKQYGPDMYSKAFVPESVTLEVDSTDISFSDPASPPQSAFCSVHIPRGKIEFFNRLSKSDDSHNSQFLATHSHTDIAQPEIFKESIEKMQNRNMNEQLVSTEKPLSYSPQTAAHDLGAPANLKQVIPNAANMKSAVHVDQVPLANQQTVCADNKYTNYLVKRVEDGGSRPSPLTYADAENHHENAGGIHLEIHQGNKAGSKFTYTNSQEQSQSSVWMGKYNECAFQGEPSVVLPRSEQGDILIDINDRFPSNILSDIFAKAILSNSSSDISPVQQDGAGMSLNMQNEEPKHWSFFQKLAGDEFVRKDISLIDQDHVAFAPGLQKFNEEPPPANECVPSTINLDPQRNSAVDGPKELPHALGDVDSQLQLGFGATQTEVSEDMHDDNMVDKSRALDIDSEDGFKNVVLPLGRTFADIDINSLQIINNEDLEELKELGSGTFGTVYHGKWRGTDVAIKRIKKSCFTGQSSELERLAIEFWREAEILSKLHHPNVVAFYGAVKDGPGGTLATVAEYMADGSLRHVLIRKDRHLDRRKRLIIAMDAAFGMEYLHSKNIVHFDLKCDNLLVNLKDPSRPICKVGDFGLSKIKRNTLVSGGVRGTLPWMAPELLNGSSSKVSEKVDVFSFGIVMWEILTGEEPYANMHYGAIIGGIVNNTLRPTIPSYCDPEWRCLMEQCWAPNPASRPSFTEIASRLRLLSSASQNKTIGHKASN